MLTCFKTESLHSFLLRRLMSVGEFNTRSIKGIVSIHGVLQAYPKILREHLKYFHNPSPNYHNVSDDHDLDLPFKIHNTLSEDEYVYINRAKFHKMGSGSHFYGRTKLRYCVDCMEERLSHDGVAWLDDEWTYVEHCPKHKHLMNELQRYKYGKINYALSIVEQLNSMYSGVCVKSGCKINNQNIKFGNTHKDYNYPSNYRFHDILCFIDNKWHGIDGEKHQDFFPQIYFD